MVSKTTVSPELTRSTGSWALSNQPHWVVSSVAGKRCTFLPFGRPTTRSFGSAGPTAGKPGVVIVAVGGYCGAAGAGAGGVVCASAVAPMINAPVAPSARRNSNTTEAMFSPTDRPASDGLQ